MPIEPVLPTWELVEEPLRLRPWQAQDAEDLFDAARSSVASVGRWLPWCHAGYERADAHAWISHCQDGWSRGEHFAFPIFDLHTGELLGGAGLNQRNRQHRSANLGYWVRQSRHGEGIAAHAAALVARFGFEQLGLIRIEIVVMPDNHASRRTAEKTGARFEAIARQRLWANGLAHDAAVYGLTQADLLPSAR
ncbi:GNAT family N-acetyltransferase [Rhodanobacter panaciterrae]|uniref:GNAT family N-acetyltransferase n=1 Tax=Rhodanobacter panaciterrae TaxID=490572 RepID=UPI001671EA80|nr:GNAT family protein [Rhodanobacter panaciterrae]